MFGYFGANGAQVRTLPPARLLDTRGHRRAAQTRRLRQPGDAPVTGRGGVPATATAVVLNVTATNVTATLRDRVADGEPKSGTSNLNVTTGEHGRQPRDLPARRRRDGRLANPIGEAT